MIALAVVSAALSGGSFLWAQRIETDVRAIGAASTLAGAALLLKGAGIILAAVSIALLVIGLTR